MGAARVGPQEIVEMYRLYAKLGSYAAVDREMRRSGSTVARYIKMEGTPPYYQVYLFRGLAGRLIYAFSVDDSRGNPAGYISFTSFGYSYTHRHNNWTLRWNIVLFCFLGFFHT